MHICTFTFEAVIVPIRYFRKMGRELCDDRKAEDNWNQIDYGDCNWSNVKVYSRPLKK